MAFDFKKEYKEFYLPKGKPQIVEVPAASYIAVEGKGDPNATDGEYKQAVAVLYAIAYTLKMSHKSAHSIEGFFEYVVPTLEGFWWQEGVDGIDLSDKSSFNWLSVIRVPDFVKQSDFDWAVGEVAEKKELDCSKAALITINEGLCVQIMHIGPYDNEADTVRIMDSYLNENGYTTDISDQRRHHEIYLSDARRVESSKWKTVIRHPIRIKEGRT